MEDVWKNKTFIDLDAKNVSKNMKGACFVVSLASDDLFFFKVIT